MTRTLLHTCCGPCASACVPRLKAMGREVTMLFANSNIDSRAEFDRRLREARKLAAADGVRIEALPYDHDEWLREVAAGHESDPERGARCARCFRYNLSKAAAYAAACGYDEFTTSLTVSPHKDSKTVFSVAAGLRPPDSPRPPSAVFLAEDFKKRDGFRLSTRRAAALGLYRQSYCGCEFSRWRLHHRAETVSTNLDARGGVHGDVFTADYQTDGRGRLGHKWLSAAGENLMMSAVLAVGGLSPEQAATLPLVVGLAVAKALAAFVPPSAVLRLKWPNDVLADGRKIAGILCERHGDNVVAGIGVNVAQTGFDPALADRATSVALLGGRFAPAVPPVAAVRDGVLGQLALWHARWRSRGFAALHPELAALDFLKGREVSVRQTEDDAAPVSGVSAGILPDGSLDVGGRRVFAGEAHVGAISPLSTEHNERN